MPPSDLASFLWQLNTVSAAGTRGRIIIEPHGGIFPAAIILWEVTRNILNANGLFLRSCIREREEHRGSLVIFNNAVALQIRYRK